MSFTILHLSDLHITEKINSSVLKNLISDIEQRCAEYEKIIIIVTGDIIDKGKFNDITIKSVYNFFNSIKCSLGDKIKGIFFTAGNHDKVINKDIDKLLIDPIISEQNVEIKEDDWENYYLVTYKSYINLISNIYKEIFQEFEFSNFKCDDTYTFNNIEIDNVLFACINLDTSWSASGGKGDFRKLRLNQTSLKKLQLEYQQFLSDNRTKKIITCVISHHPINWLDEKDESLILSWLLNCEYFNANLYLCGHTHDRKVQNFYDNVHSYLTLVTGIGWDSTSATQVNNQNRYSIYNLNINNHYCEIITRKTNVDSQFDYDYDVLLTPEEKVRKSILIPLNMQKSYPFIDIPIFSEVEPECNNYLFVDNQTLSKIPIFLSMLNDFCTHMVKFQFSIVRDFYLKCELDKNTKKSNEIHECYNKYFYQNIESEEVINLILNVKNTNMIYNNFNSFLQQICQYLKKIICENKINLNLIGDVRIHFRRLAIIKDNINYIAFCQDNSENLPELRDIGYHGSLIQKSFDRNIAYIYSHNYKYGKLEPKKWKNFMTIAPNVSSNAYSFKDGNKKIFFPKFSFAISIEKEADTHLLENLNFLGIKQIIEDIVFNFMDLFKIDAMKFFDFLDEQNDAQERIIP